MPAPVYSVSDKKTATISGDGTLTPLKTGKVTVYAKSCGRTMTKEITVN